MHFSILSDLKKTTAVVESLSTTSTRCSVTEITSLLQDSTNRIRNLHQINIIPALLVPKPTGHGADEKEDSHCEEKEN